MKNIKFAVSLFALVCTSACGKNVVNPNGLSTDLNSTGNTIGSCKVKHVHGEFCIEMSQAESVTSAGKKLAEKECSLQFAQFEEKGCDINLGIGFCSYSEKLVYSGEGITLDRVIVFHAPFPEDNARNFCSPARGHQYSPTAPKK